MPCFKKHSEGGTCWSKLCEYQQNWSAVLGKGRKTIDFLTPVRKIVSSSP